MVPMSEKEPAESSRVITFVWCILILGALGLLFLPELLMFFLGGFFDEWGRNTLGEDYLLILLAGLLVGAGLVTLLTLSWRRRRHLETRTRSLPDSKDPSNGAP